MAEWYYARNNQRNGPVTMDQMKQLGAAGQLSPTDLVWKDGMANWAAASTIPGLFPAPAPVPVQKAPAAVAAPLAPAPALLPEEVVPLDMGPAGPSIVDTAMLIATRAVSANLETMKVSDAEKDELSKAGVTGETAQRYLVWRRSVLWVAAVPLVFTGISLIIDSMVYWIASLNGLGMLLEILRVLTMLALPAAAVLGALTWSKPQLSMRLATLGLLVGYGLPLLMLLLPASWIIKVDLPKEMPKEVRNQVDSAINLVAKHGLRDFGGGGPGAPTIPWPILIGVAISLVSLAPGLLRGSLRVRTLLPEAVSVGLILVAVALMSALFSFGVLYTDPHFSTAFFGLVFTVCVVLAPLCYLVGAKAFLRPIATAGDRSAVALWQWIYYGLCGGAGLFAFIQMVATDGVGAYGYWIAILLFLDFLGRSLFASVVASQFILSLTRSVTIAHQQLAKTEQGAALDRRLSELEPIVGKM